MKNLHLSGGTMDISESAQLDVATATIGGVSTLSVDGLGFVDLREVTFLGGTNLGDGTMRLWGKVYMDEPTVFQVPTAFLGSSETRFDESQAFDLVIGRRGFIDHGARFISNSNTHHLRILSDAALSLQDDSRVDLRVINAGTILLGEQAPYLAQAALEDYEQLSSGRLAIDLRGIEAKSFDQLIVSNDVSLRGTLQVSFLDGFVPDVGNAFEFIQSEGEIEGRFDTNIVPGLGPNLAWWLNYSNDRVMLSLRSTANMLAGDADGDGRVTFPDFLSLSHHFSKPGIWSDGDFDGNGLVEFADFLLLSDNFGIVATRAVPEPTGLGLTGVCLALIYGSLARRRGRLLPVEGRESRHST